MMMKKKIDLLTEKVSNPRMITANHLLLRDPSKKIAALARMMTSLVMMKKKTDLPIEKARNLSLTIADLHPRDLSKKIVALVRMMTISQVMMRKKRDPLTEKVKSLRMITANHLLPRDLSRKTVALVKMMTKKTALPEKMTMKKIALPEKMTMKRRDLLIERVRSPEVTIASLLLPRDLSRQIVALAKMMNPLATMRKKRDPQEKRMTDVSLSPEWKVAVRNSSESLYSSNEFIYCYQYVEKIFFSVLLIYYITYVLQYDSSTYHKYVKYGHGLAIDQYNL
jgi:hypothetical protein